MGAADVLDAETTHPFEAVLTIAWEVDDKPVKPDAGSRTLDLSTLRLSPGSHKVTATLRGRSSSEGLSPQPWEEREPGYGTHRIEYRAIDAAGNIGPAKAFMAAVTPK